MPRIHRYASTASQCLQNKLDCRVGLEASFVRVLHHLATLDRNLASGTWNTPLDFADLLRKALCTHPTTRGVKHGGIHAHTPSDVKRFLRTYEPEKAYSLSWTLSLSSTEAANRSG